MTADVAGSLGTGIDGTVRKITYHYDDHMRRYKVGSYTTADATIPLNEVGFEYNGFGQLTADRQEHGGAVGGGTLEVGYSYESGGSNTLRGRGMTYPSGVSTTVKYTGTAADKLSRPDLLALGGTDEVAYRYLGLGRVVGTSYTAITTLTTPPVEMTYEDGTSPAGDKYSGLDDFGRVVETLWKQGTTVIDNITYGYNRASNRQWRRNRLAHDSGGSEANRHDNFYWYDGLHQVVQRQVGNLTGTAPNYTGIDTRQQNEDWCYDAIGNWNHYDNEDDSNLSQFRGHNGANEITSVTNPAGVVQPACDKVGNQTFDIAPGNWDTRYELKWDAWNRIVEVRNGSTLVQTNAYDGLTRRVTSADGTGTTHYYYNTAWRAVEQYLNSGTSPERRHLWGLRSRWDLVKREIYDGGSLDEIRYVLYDAMDPVAICDDQGTITARFEYSPFGRVSFMNPNFSAATTPADWDFLFHGEFLDSPSGYYNYGYRFYNTATGRWPSRDPIGEWSGINLYGFVENNGVNEWDVLGQTPPSAREKTDGSTAFTDLASKLKTIAKECCICPKAESDAEAMAKSIRETWENAYGKGNINTPHSCGGYYCAHWAKAFTDAATISIKGSCWNADLKWAPQFYYSKKDHKYVQSIVVHYYAKITASGKVGADKSKCSIIVDDSYSTGEFTHDPNTYLKGDPEDKWPDIWPEQNDAENEFKIFNTGDHKWKPPIIPAKN